MTLDPRAYAAERIAGTRPAMGWATADAADPVRWQKALRSRLARCLGNLEDWERPDLEARVTRSVQLDGYRRDSVEFTSRPGLTAFGYLLIPDGLTDERRPAVLCLPGHGRGVDSTVGIAPDGSQRSLGKPDEYAADFPLRCVAAGYVALALEQISFGYRRDAIAVKAGPEASSCARDSMAALMLGETIIGWRVWDAMRALDYLLTRPEVDPERLVTMGISGGGLTSLFTAALDTRVSVCVVSGYLNTFADSVLAIPHCVDNYAPGLFALCEMPDVAGLVAPRLLFAESGRYDPIFPLAGFEKAVAHTGQIYGAFSASEHFAQEVFEGEHRFHGEGIFTFLDSHL